MKKTMRAVVQPDKAPFTANNTLIDNEGYFL